MNAIHQEPSRRSAIPVIGRKPSREDQTIEWYGALEEAIDQVRRVHEASEIYLEKLADEDSEEAFALGCEAILKRKREACLELTPFLFRTGPVEEPPGHLWWSATQEDGLIDIEALEAVAMGLPPGVCPQAIEDLLGVHDVRRDLERRIRDRAKQRLLKRQRRR